MVGRLQREREMQQKEREEREAEWRANEERVREQERLWGAIPEGPEKHALLLAMTDRAVELMNNVKFEEADAILEFLPRAWVLQLYEWYFHDDDGKVPHPADAPPSQDEAAQQGQVQGEPQLPERPDGERPIEAASTNSPGYGRTSAQRSRA